MFPASPAIATVSFDGIKPDDAGIDVPENFTYDMSVFQHNDVWNAILSKIESDLEDGATGLDPTIEAAIYQRHKDRQQIENDRIYRETEDMYGAAGFNLPTGAMVGEEGNTRSVKSGSVGNVNIGADGIEIEFNAGPAGASGELNGVYVC